MSESLENRRRTDARPTLRTISDMTGLAVTTVSRALNDAPDIGDATKIRVRDVAAKVGYRPNRAGVRLRTGKTNVISLVLSTEDHMTNHTAQLVYSISDSLRGTPYHMIVTPFSAHDDPMDPIRYIVETGSADGVIINQIRPDDPRVRYMTEHDFPFATHGRTAAGLSHPHFDFDNLAFGELAVRELVARGRKRIVLIGPPPDQSYALHMLDGVQRAAKAAGVTATLLADANGDQGFAPVHSAIKELSSGPDHPDGVVSASTAATMATVAAIESHGLKIGRDIDLVGKEAIPFLSYFRKEIIVVREDVKQAGAFLAKALVQRIKSPSEPPLKGIETPRVAKSSLD